MKKLFSFIVVLALIVTSAISLVGCKDDDVIVAAAMVKDTNVVNACDSEAEAKELGYQLKTWYKNGDYVVYQYFLGVVDSVPLQSQERIPDFHFTGLAQTEISLTTSVTTAESIANTAAEVVTNTVENNWETTDNIDLKVTVGASVSATVGFVSTEAKMEIETSIGSSLTKGESTSDSYTTENSYQKATTNEESSQVSIKCTLDETCEIGYYRFVNTGTFHIFANVIFNVKTSEFSIENYAYLASTTRCLEFSANGEYESTSREMLELKASDLQNLEIPEYLIADSVQKPEPEPEPEILSDPIVYKNDSRRKITHDGKWGLAEKTYDTIDLSSFSAYMKDDYVFSFKVECFIEEENDGYQEIYIYNNLIITSKDVEESVACQYGKIAGSGGLETVSGGIGSQVHNLSYNNILGSNIRTTMYLRYDAWGKGNDTWYISNLKVTVTVARKAS